MSPDDILPAAHVLAGALLIAAAFLVGYIAEKAQDCLRRAFYATLSACFTLAAASLLFGNLLAVFVRR